MNALLVGIWVVTGAEFFWPVFPLLGWGIGLGFHAWDTYRVGEPTERQIQREMEHLRSHTGSEVLVPRTTGNETPLSWVGEACSAAARRCPRIAPVMIGAFDGWIDAGAASSTVAERLADGAETIAKADRRAVRLPLATPGPRRRGRDALTSRVAGDIDRPPLRRRPQPARAPRTRARLRWREMADGVMETALRLGIVQWISLGSIPAAVPHTRPVRVFGTASSAGLLHDDVEQGPQGLLRVPAAALSVVEMAVAGAGIPTVGFYAQVPHYVGGPFAAAAIGLLEELGRHLGVDLPSGTSPTRPSTSVNGSTPRWAR